MFTHWLAPPTTSLPPDTIIEVGPPPFTRYAAHSALVSAHSGYLRAALRSESSTGSTDTVPIYVPNVTADQFTPLLTYMYTGFLDLNIENIFGVLLATHILHMPRALELCRSFLSATQSENYFGGLTAMSAVTANSIHNLSPKLKPETEASGKVVRPIASKATGIGLNFVAPPTSHILLPSTHTPFKSLSGLVVGCGGSSTTATAIVESVENSSSPPGTAVKLTNSTDTACSSNASNERCNETEMATEEQLHRFPKEHQATNQKRQSKSQKRSTTNKMDPVITAAGGAVTKDTTINDKGVIIDIASCDGPVRFRRVLNDSYGMNSNCSTNNHNIGTSADELKGHSRYMSVSFHQQVKSNVEMSVILLKLCSIFFPQMVRNINERKQSLALGESCNNKDENSQDNNQYQNSPQSATTSGSGTAGSATGAVVGSNETYNCVYCKHTFKSQYCYQKHAKRHLIPLSLEVGSVTAGDEIASVGDRQKEPSTSATLVRHGGKSTGCPGGGGGATKREVKPLDMNVQYYPCKTCGSKFPSYYFVHKHRKMCHAEEEVL